MNLSISFQFQHTKRLFVFTFSVLSMLKSWPWRQWWWLSLCLVALKYFFPSLSISHFRFTLNSIQCRHRRSRRWWWLRKFLLFPREKKKTERNFVHVKETWGCVTRRMRRRKRTNRKKMRIFRVNQYRQWTLRETRTHSVKMKWRRHWPKLNLASFCWFLFFFWPFQYHFPLPHQPSLLLSLLCYLVCHLIAAAAAMVVDWAFSLHFICSSFTFHYVLLFSSPLCAILIEFSRARKRECCWRN